MSKKLASAVCGAFLILAVSACSPDSTPAAKSSDKASKALIPVKIGSLQAGVSNALVAVAEESGAFAANGLAATIVPYASGAAGADVSDLETGRTDFTYSSLTVALTYDSQAVLAGSPPPLTIVLAAATGAANLVLAKDIAFSGPKDLKGLTLGVARLTSSYIPIFDSYLREKGTSIKELGINFVVVTDPNMVPALTTGQIKGFIQNQPTSTVAETNGVGKIVLSLDDWGKASKVPILGLFTTSKWLKSEKNQDITRRVVKSFEMANEAYIAGPKSRWVPVIANYTGAPVDVVTTAYEKLTLRLALPFKEAMNAYFAISVPALIEQGVVSPKVTVSDVADFTYSK